MEELHETQQHEYRWQSDGERRSAAQGVYAGEERRKADAQLDQMANGQSDG
jgi:hypothetical protein